MEIKKGVKLMSWWLHSFSSWAGFLTLENICMKYKMTKGKINICTFIELAIFKIRFQNVLKEDDAHAFSEVYRDIMVFDKWITYKQSERVGVLMFPLHYYYVPY